MSIVPNPGSGLPYRPSHQMNPEGNCWGSIQRSRLSHSPKAKPTAGSGLTQCGGCWSGGGSGINNKVVFSGAAAEEMTGMCSYIHRVESGVLNTHSPRPVQAPGKAGTCGAALHDFPDTPATQGLSGSENRDKENETFSPCKQCAPYLPPFRHSCSPCRAVLSRDSHPPNHRLWEENHDAKHPLHPFSSSAPFLNFR